MYSLPIVNSFINYGNRQYLCKSPRFITKGYREFSIIESNLANGFLANAEEGVIQVYDELGIEAPEYSSSPVFIPLPSFVHGANENEIYWFHPDHLGSTSYITNVLGEVSQQMEYFAFGETFVEEHRSSNNSPYQFNGKSWMRKRDGTIMVQGIMIHAYQSSFLSIL